MFLHYATLRSMTLVRDWDVGNQTWKCHPDRERSVVEGPAVSLSVLTRTMKARSFCRDTTKVVPGYKPKILLPGRAITTR